MFWRLIDDIPHDASYNMALDEAISEAVRKNLSSPTLRLYQWDKPSISIGFFQKVSDINLDYCNKKGYTLVRRTTGGKAVLHNSELTYSFSTGNDLEPFKGGLRENYMVLSKAFVLALKSLHLDVKIMLLKKSHRERSPFCFKVSSYGEITINGKKVIGNAQKRYKNGFLQQGSILMDFNAEELGKVLRNYNPPPPPFSKGGLGGLSLKGGKPACPVGRGRLSGEIGAIRKYAPSCSVENLRDALKKSFERIFNVKLIPGYPTAFESDLAQKLKKEKYSKREWNYCR